MVIESDILTSESCLTMSIYIDLNFFINQMLYILYLKIIS